MPKRLQNRPQDLPKSHPRRFQIEEWRGSHFTSLFLCPFGPLQNAVQARLGFVLGSKLATLGHPQRFQNRQKINVKIVDVSTVCRTIFVFWRPWKQVGTKIGSKIDRVFNTVESVRTQACPQRHRADRFQSTPKPSPEWSGRSGRNRLK